MKKFIKPEDYPYGLSCKCQVWQSVKASSIIALGRDDVFHDDTHKLLRATLRLGLADCTTIKWDYKSRQERDEVFDLLLKDLEEDKDSETNFCTNAVGEIIADFVLKLEDLGINGKLNNDAAVEEIKNDAMEKYKILLQGL